MKIAKINLVYFSPTGSTKKVLKLMGERWTEEYEATVQEMNLTAKASENETWHFAEKELVFIGVPSFGGRVPATAAERLNHMRGSNTPAVLVTTYGNRAYEDTLLELRDIVRKNGFVVVAAAAVVTEHSIFHEIASGRPNIEDRGELWHFAGKIQKTLSGIEDIRSGVTLSLPGNRPYKEYKGILLKPEAGKQCTRCGICARECPVGAISEENPLKMDAERCISCMRCVHVCPQHSRTAGGLVYAMAQKKMKKVCAEARKNELFLPE